MSKFKRIISAFVTAAMAVSSFSSFALAEETTTDLTVLKSYNYDTDASTASSVTVTGRYLFDDVTFKDLHGYGGSLYWDWDYDKNGTSATTDSHYGKPLRIKAGNLIDMNTLPVGTYIEQSFDMMYNIHDGYDSENTYIRMMMVHNSGSAFHEFNIKGGYITSRTVNGTSRTDTKFKLAMSENELHRVKFTLLVTEDEDENRVIKVVQLSVDGNEADTQYIHEIAVPSVLADYSKYQALDFTPITGGKFFTLPSSTEDLSKIWVDNYSLVTYTSETGVSPVGDKASLSKKLQQMSELLLSDSVDDALKTKIEGLLPDVVTVYKDADATSDEVSAAEATLSEVDTALENYTKLAEYEEKLALIIDQTDVKAAIEAAKTAIVSGDEDAVTEAFEALEALEARLPQSIANFTFDTASATRSSVTNTSRYIFDGETFKDIYGFGGTYYWDFDYDSDPSDIGNGTVTEAQAGKAARLKAYNYDLASLPVGTCVETSLDLKYHLHPDTELVMSMVNESGAHIEDITIDSMGFASRHETGFSVSAIDDEMHRVKLVMQVQQGEEEGSKIYKLINLSVDGNEAPSAYIHEVRYPDNVSKYQALDFTIVTNAKWNTVPTENTEDFTRVWVDNYSVVTYYSEDGSSLLGDKATLSRQLQQLSGIVNSESTGEELKAEITAMIDDMVTVYHDPLATQAQVDVYEDKAAEIIIKAIKEEYENWVNTEFGFEKVTEDVTEMKSGFTSTLTSTIFDVDYTISNQSVLDTDGTVIRPKINETVTVTASAAANVTGQTFSSQFEARIMAKGEETELPVSGELLAYADVSLETAGTVSVNATGIDAAVNAEAGENEIQLYADTNKGKYAIFVNGEKAKEGEFEAESITEAVIGNAEVKYMVPDAALYELNGMKFKIGDSDREYTKLLSGARVAAVELMDKNVFEENAQLIVASYTGGELYSVNTAVLSDLALDADNKVEIELELPEDISDVTISAFVFSSLGNIVPLAVKYDYAPDVSTAVGATVYIAGDSTAQKYTWNETENSGYPQAGWGQMFGNYFLDGLNIVNAAIGGATLKTYYSSTDRTRSFNFIKENILPGDYMLIQFGHNDYIRSDDTEETLTNKRCTIDEFKNYLKLYAEMAWEAGATPIFMTCTQRRADAANPNNAPEPYRQAARDMAAELGIDCIDAGEMGVKLLTAIGKDTAGRFLHMYIEENDIRYINDPRFTAKNVALEDSTHLNEYGANVYAMLFAREFLNLDSTQAIAAYVDEEKMLDDEALTEKILADYNAYLELKASAE